MDFELISCVKIGYYEPHVDKELRLLCEYFDNTKTPYELFGLKDLDSIDINKWLWKHYTLVDIRMFTDYTIVGMIGIEYVGKIIPLCKIEKDECMTLLTDQYDFEPYLKYFEALSKFDENEELTREYYASEVGKQTLVFEYKAQKTEWSL
jgi:hypothetical protein